MDENAFVNEVDMKVAAPEFAALPVVEIVRRTDNGANAMRGEVIAQENEFIRGRQIFPIENGDVRRAHAAPFAVTCKQGVEQSFDR